MSLRRTQYTVSKATGRYGLTGEVDITWEPRMSIPNAPVVIILHGLLGTADYFMDYQASYPKLMLMGPLLASYGFKAIALDGGLRSGGTAPNNALTHFGNPSHTARIETVRTSLGVSKLSFLGVSMGGFAAFQYAVNHPTNTGALVAYSGISDVVAFYNDNGQPAYLADAWGVTSPNPLPPGADVTSDANLVGMPWLAFHCQDDATVPYSTVTAMASHIGSSARLVSFAAGGHEGTLQQADFEEVVSWIWDFS